MAPLAPGFATFAFSPQPADLAFARCVFPTLRGDVRVAWERDAQGIAIELCVPDGTVAVTTRGEGERVLIDIHDSGPGLSDAVSATLFEPTITFKKHGMGLGLSIAKKNALLSGGDVTLIPGQLGGAGFRVSLPS